MQLRNHRKYTIPPGVLIVTGLLSLLLFLVMAWLVFHRQTVHFDKTVAASLGNPTDSGIAFMVFITFFGSSQFLVACYVLLTIFMLVQKRIFHALLFVLAGLTGYFIVYYLKKAFQRPRPYHQLIDTLTNFSFPSGHACSGLLLYGLLSYFLWQGSLPLVLKILCILCLLAFSFFIGITRVYLGVHYASDVVAGFMLACFFLSIVIYLTGREK